MGRSIFSIGQNQEMIVAVVSEISKVRCSLNGANLYVETIAPFDDENEYGPRMDRVENVVRGLDPATTREDLQD